ncbi:hypothetical protein C1H46_019821 [Malus baccata]|uniref:Uncharacterized protein n=1 Tax=Malus baccata TaxID=106549 RepID=A0A540M789_MALBA|nr:hypothetical protein C1H46_019821 [Malus baccata]
MAAMNSSVLAYNYAVSGAGRSELAKAKTTCMLSVELAAQTKIVAIRAQQPSTQNSQAAAGRKDVMPSLEEVAFTTVSSNSAANADVIDDYLEKCKANKPLPLKNIPGDYSIPFKYQSTVLFDFSKVENNDIFTGTYLPSLELTDDYRILSYLDPSELKHDKLKRVIFYLLKSSCDSILPEFHLSFNLHSLPGDYGLPFLGPISNPESCLEEPCI